MFLTLHVKHLCRKSFVNSQKRNQHQTVWFWIPSGQLLSFPVPFQNIDYILVIVIFCWNGQKKLTDSDSVVRFFGWSKSVSVCGSCTLAVLVDCGLSSVLFVFLQFLFFLPLIPLISLTVASLQVVAQDFISSCNHCLTLSLFSVILMSCWSLLQPPQLCSLLYLLLSLCCGSALLSFFVFWGNPLSSSSVCWLAFFLIVRHPLPLLAVRSPMVQCCACLQFCGWSVGLSPVHVQLCQLVLCCGLSSEWTMCIKLHSFLVWHKLILTLRLSKCHVAVMLWWSSFLAKFCLGS